MIRQAEGIKVFNPKSDPEDVAAVRAECEALAQAMPFAVIGSVETHDVGGVQRRGRRYGWGKLAWPTLCTVLDRCQPSPSPRLLPCDSVQVPSLNDAAEPPRVSLGAFQASVAVGLGETRSSISGSRR